MKLLKSLQNALGFISSQPDRVAVFPRRDAIVRTLTLPATDPREILDMVRLQAARQTPLGIDDLSVTHEVLEKSADGHSKVMMVIVHRQTLRRYLSGLEEAGLRPTRVVLDSVSCGPAFNLLPEEEQREKRREERRRELAGVLAFSILLSGSFAGLVAQHVRAKKNELARLNQASLAIFPQVKDLRRMENRLESAQAQLNQRGSFLAVLDELSRLLPGRVSLKAVDFEKERSLVVQGTCLSLSDALRWVEILGKSPLFSAVELRSSDAQRVRDQDIVNFVLYAKI